MKNLIKFALGPCLIVLLFSLFPARAADKEIDRLINEQKYAEALKLVQKDLDEMKAEKKDREWAQLIVKEAMLQVGLHGYETAVKNLRAREWPKDAVAHAMVSIAYSRTLQNYQQAYSWEIRKREEVAGEKDFDLKKLTSREIYQEAYAGFEKAWKVRADLGKYKRSELPEIITPNNYPSEVRGTLRDTLSYLIAVFFGDSSGWSPEEANSAYTMDANDLLSGTLKLSLTDQNVHPFKKLAYVLRDLESWHASKGDKEAALEARLELYRYLWGQLSSLSAKRKIRDSLEADIGRQKKNPWVAMAYARMADFVRGDGDEKKAREWARKGGETFPSSPGAARCRDIVREIDQPSLAIEGMNIDASSKRSLGLQYKNLRKVWFRSYKIDFKKFVQSTKDYSLRPGWRELEKYLRETPAYQWQSELSETTDYKQHRQYITPPAHTPGFYAFLVSTSPQFSEGIVTGIEMFVSDYVFQISRDYEKQIFDVQVLRGTNGIPVKDAVVSIYSANYQTGHKLQKEEKTDAEGRAEFVTRSILNTQNSFFFVVEKDGQVIASKNTDSMYAAGKMNNSVSEAFIYTDRSIYRPEQKVHWKVVAYRGDKAGKNFKVDADQVVTVELHDANYEVVQKKTVKTNTFGSASGEFSIPKGKLLGNWSLTTSHGGNSSLKVEEYKRPTFLVEFEEKMDEMRLNKDAFMKGKAKYYFGSPLTNGKVKWVVYRQAILPWWCFWGGWSWSDLQSNDLVATGMTALKDDGSFEFKFRPTADEDVENAKDIRYNYQVKVDVTDEGGETRSADLSNVIGLTAVTASLTPVDNFFLADKKVEIQIVRSDLNGRPLAGKGKWKLLRVKVPSKTLAPSDIPAPKELQTLTGDKLILPDDMKQPRWAPDYRYELYLRQWEEGEVVASGDAEHAGNGKYAVTVPALKEGVYRLRYETRDSFNGLFEDQKEILVVGKNSRFPLPGLLLLQRSSLEPGQTAKILAMSGFDDQRMVLEIFRSGKRVVQKVLHSGKDNSLIEVPLKEEDRGGLGVGLAVVNDYQDIRFSDNLMVPWSNKLVDVEFSSMRDKIRPGMKETWNITLKGKNGKKLGPESFELLTYMYDKSLDVFGPHQPPMPIGIYPSGIGTSFPNSELGAGALIYTNLSYISVRTEFTPFSEDQVNYYPNYGIGGPGRRGRLEGMMMKGAGMNSQRVMESAPSAALADAADIQAKPKAESLGSKIAEEKKPAPVEMRTNFSETAFWKPH
ncbi:MAG: MG2 domain-containing protein, partial [Bacteriovoracaceae bacterium]